MSIENLSIIVVNYNTTKMVNEIERFCFNNNINLIIVDNSNNYISLTNHSKLIQPGSNLGFGKACNLGAENSDSDILLFLNPDAVIDIDTLKYLSSREVPTSTIWGPVVSGDGNNVKILEHNDKGFLKFIRYARALTSFNTDVFSTCLISGACLFIYRKNFLELDGFDEDIFMYAEDLDLCLKNIDNGGDCRLFLSTNVKHIGGTSSVGKDKLIGKYRRLMRSYNGHYSFFNKRYSFIISIINSIYLSSGFVSKFNKY
ncbi:glycosyltransferase [Vibrio fluvialis]